MGELNPDKKQQQRQLRRPETNSAIIPTDEAHDALLRGTSRGGDDAAWRGDEQARAWLFGMDGLSHWLRLEMLPTDAPNSEALETLKRLRSLMTTNATFVVLHLLNLMLQAEPTPENPTTNVITTLDKIITDVGLDPRSALQRQQMRADIWAVIQFGERANVIGERRGTYIGPDAREIKTEINGAAWRVVATETPEQRALFGDVPVRVEIAASAEWMRLLKTPEIAQYVPGMALLAPIPGGQASGAYARSIGLALAGFWRRNTSRVIADDLRPTRKELLTRFPPAVAPTEEVFAGKDPRRVIEYWCGALQALVARGFVENSGEAILTFEQHTAELKRKNWQPRWMDTAVDLQPGPAMRGAIEALANRKPPRKALLKKG